MATASLRSGNGPINNSRVDDEWARPDDAELVENCQREHFLNRLRIILSGQHQPLIAGILLACLILMSSFFSYRWLTEQGLVDIDQAQSIRTEFKVDINSAKLGEIVVLPGVGRKLAQAIIDHRQASGEFVSLDQLCDVSGIGEKKLETLRPYLLPIRPLAVQR